MSARTKRHVQPRYNHGQEKKMGLAQPPFTHYEKESAKLRLCILSVFIIGAAFGVYATIAEMVDPHPQAEYANPIDCFISKVDGPRTSRCRNGNKPCGTNYRYTTSWMFKDKKKCNNTFTFTSSSRVSTKGAPYRVNQSLVCYMKYTGVCEDTLLPSEFDDLNSGFVFATVMLAICLIAEIILFWCCWCAITLINDKNCCFCCYDTPDPEGQPAPRSPV